MKRWRIVLLSLAFVNISLPSAAMAGGQSSEPGYWHSLGYGYKRAFKNILGSPLEIPITVGEYHAKEGRPVLRHLAGFGDGTFQMITRMFSGLWDLGSAWVPGAQEGYPPDPEMLF